jgi:hypothetical protein
MRLVEIAIGTVLRIPLSWDAFVYREYRYTRHGERFVRMAKVEADKKVQLPREKDAVCA